MSPVFSSRIRDPLPPGSVAPRRPAALDGGGAPPAADFERMWRARAPIGRAATSGGYSRQPFTQPERELADWFREQAAARDLRLQSDLTGNLVAWWDPPAAIVADVSDGVARESGEKGLRLSG